MDQEKEKRIIGRRTKYLDKDVPEEIGEERRSALQQIYEDNRKGKKRERRPRPKKIKKTTIDCGTSTLPLVSVDTGTSTSPLVGLDHGNTLKLTSRPVTRDVGVEARESMCICALRGEKTVRFPRECGHCWVNRQDANFWREKAVRLQKELEYREGQLKTACLELRQLRRDRVV